MEPPRDNEQHDVQQERSEGMNERGLARIDNGAVAEWNDDRVDLLKRTIAKDATDSELELFIQVCKRTGLDPFAKQIYAIHRNTKQGKVMNIQVSIDGLRLIAERTGKYLGQTETQWCGDDGEWKDVWLTKEHPAAAKVGVYKEGTAHPTYGIAHWDEYVQTFRDGNPMGLWASMPRNMLAKCAESLALRKAFPQEMSGVYTDAEMAQADNDTPRRAPAVQTEAATEAQWIPVEDGSDDRVDVETGEIVEGQVVEEDGITEAQVRLISRIADEKRLSPEALQDIIKEGTTASSVGTLSKREASAIIDVLKEWERKDLPADDSAEEAFAFLLRDLNNLTGQDASDLFDPQEPVDERLKRIKPMVITGLIQQIKQAEDAPDLDSVKEKWGQHKAWRGKVVAAYDERMEELTGISADEMAEVPF